MHSHQHKAYITATTSESPKCPAFKQLIKVHGCGGYGNIAATKKSEAPKQTSTLHSTISQSKVQAAPSCKIYGAEQTGHTGAQGKLWLYYTPSTEHGRHILQPRGENWRSIKNRAMMGVQWQVLRSCTDWSHRSEMKTLAALLPMHRAWPPHTATARRDLTLHLRMIRGSSAGNEGR